MTNEDAIKYLIRPVVSSTDIGEEKQKELDAYDMAIAALKNPIIEINGKKYIAEKPKLKTVHKEGEVVIGGFRALDEVEE